MMALVWILRVLVILLILRYINMMFARRGPAPTPRRAPQAPAERTGGRLVRDPQCGTYVPESSALALSHRGSVEHFCSAACRDAWTLAHPR